MPAKSQSQQRLMQAAAHGATFKKAVDLRQSMNHQATARFCRRADEGQTGARGETEGAMILDLASTLDLHTWYPL